MINSIVMETALLEDKTRKEILDQIANTKSLLDSIAIGKISNWVVEDVLKNVDADYKDYAVAVLDKLFPVTL